jgi:hypothetical protein
MRSCSSCSRSSAKLAHDLCSSCYSRKRATANKAKGLCRCGRERVEGTARCSMCRDRLQAKYLHNKEAKLCRCGELRLLGKKSCAACTARVITRRVARAQQGLCTACGKHPCEAPTQFCSSCRTLMRNRLRKINTGFSPEMYAAKFEAQGGRCVVCSTTSSKPLHADHNHETGECRDLLCASCNVTLGHVREDIKRLEGLITYLRRWHKK